MKVLKNKKGVIAPGMMVMAIASLTLLIVLLIVYSGFFEGDINSICKLSALANSKARIPGAGESIKLECEMDILTITMQDLEKGMEQAERKIIDFNKKFDPDYTLNPENKIDQKEWVLNKIMANELRRWWSNMGAGNLNLFSNWWWFFGCGGENKIDCEDEGMLNKLKVWNWKTYGPPTFCVIGTRIKFDQDIKNEFKSEITSLNEWLYNNPIPYTDKSYYEYLSEEAHEGYDLFRQNYYDYNTNEPMAVVFININQNMLETSSNEIINQLREKPVETLAGIALFSKKKYLLGASALLLGGGGSTAIKATSIKTMFNTITILPYSKLNETCTVIAN